MIASIYKKAFSALRKHPFRLWGMSLLASVLYLAACVGFVGVPAAAFCAELLLSASLLMIYLNSYRTGLEPKAAYLFAAFHKDRIWRVLGGMAWMQLWIFLWALIPVVGIVFACIRAYEYSFVPYILMTREDVRPTEAIRISRQETMGYKGKMFGADMLLVAIGFGAALLLALLGLIPYLGALFRILRYPFLLLVGVISPLLRGILSAAFYVEIQNRRAMGAQQTAAPAQPVPPVIPAPAPVPEAQPAPQAEADAPACPEPSGQPVCPHCGAPVKAPEAVFCTACGKRLHIQ